MSEKIKLDDLNLFLSVVESGSYTATARSINIPVATITRRIHALEDAINLRLFSYNARKLSLTETGKLFYQSCSPLMRELIVTVDELTEVHKGAEGKIKISSPSNLTKCLMMPIFIAFMKQYPRINIELSTHDGLQYQNLSDWDIIFSVGSQPDSNLIARRIRTVKDILVASPEYLAKSPTLTHADELVEHSLLKGYPLLEWELTHTDGEKVINHDKGRFDANTLDVVRRACSGGVGIGLMPNAMLTEYLERGELVRVLDCWSANSRDLYMLYHGKDHLPEKIRLFIDFTVEYAKKI